MHAGRKAFYREAIERPGSFIWMLPDCKDLVGCILMGVVFQPAVLHIILGRLGKFQWIHKMMYCFR